MWLLVGGRKGTGARTHRDGAHVHHTAALPLVAAAASSSGGGGGGGARGGGGGRGRPGSAPVAAGTTRGITAGPTGAIGSEAGRPLHMATGRLELLLQHAATVS